MTNSQCNSVNNFKISTKIVFSELLFNISKQVTNPTQLRSLGIGLGLKSYEISTIEQDNQGNINGAGYKLLLVWRDKKSSEQMSERKMEEVLKTFLSSDSVGMRLVSSECFGESTS